MERLSLFFFNIRAFFQSALYLIIRLFSSKASEKYMAHIDKVCTSFGIKAIRKEWALVLCDEMRMFASFPKFRRELILSQLHDTFVLDMLRYVDMSDLSLDEIKLIALNRKFNETGTVRLSSFKSRLMRLDFENKLEVIKIFYKNSQSSESSDILSEHLLKETENDFDFWYWLAINEGASATIKKEFIRRITAGEVSKNAQSELRTFVEKVGLIGCDVEKLNGYSELLLDIREYLTRPEDIEIWEYYLLKGKNPEIIKLHVRRHGIESKNGLKMLLELNNKDVTDAYNFHNSVGKRLTS